MSALGWFAFNACFGAVVVALGWISLGGWLAGVALGTWIGIVTSFAGWSLLATFFILGSIATRLGYRYKRALGAAQARRGRRGAREALANSAVAIALVTWAALDPARVAGDGFRFAFSACFATALADTTASELGPLIATPARHPLSWRRGKPGDDGLVSIGGTLAGIAAALALAGVAISVGFVDRRALIIVPLCAAAASYVESIAGSLDDGGRSTTRRSWRGEWLNLGNTALGALLAAIAVQ